MPEYHVGLADAVVTLCLNTALVHHDLIDAIPAAPDVAIPRGSHRARLTAPTRLHQFDRDSFDVGRDELEVGARRPLGIYSAERSIIDVVRHTDPSRAPGIDVSLPSRSTRAGRAYLDLQKRATTVVTDPASCHGAGSVVVVGCWLDQLAWARRMS